MENKDTVVSLCHVSRYYASKRITAVKDLSLDICRGEFVAILGKSGSGKSTLLNMISGLDRPSAGRVLINGKEPSGNREWGELRSRHIGFIFQAFNLLPRFTALENVEIPMFGLIHSQRERSEKALSLLKDLGLAQRAHHLPGELSGGERQRVAIARSLANSPGLILADEPTGNLDSKTSKEIVDLLTRIYESKKMTIIVVTHNEDIAAIANRIIRVVDGAIAREGKSG